MEGGRKPIRLIVDDAYRVGDASIPGSQMLQSAIFADLQVNSFGIPTVRLTPQLPVISWARISFSALATWLRDAASADEAATLSEHLRRDIGLAD